MRCQEVGTMKKMRCETIWAYGFILLAMTLLPLAGFGQEEATPTPAVEQTWQALVEAARAEGKLVISSNSLHESLPQAFEKKYGIRTILEASSGREATNRLLAERRAGIHAVDIFIAGRGTMRSRLLPAGVLGSIPDLLINPEVVDQSLWREGHWYGDPDQKYVFFFAMNASSDNAYNTNLVDPKDVRSWWDLLDPRWRGKLIASHPVRRPGTEATRAWLYTHPALGPDYIRRIYTETGMKLVATDREMANGIATGAFAIDVALTALLIGPPTVLMGGTIPLLTQGLSRSLEDASRLHALVYSFNTAGAFGGALCAGFFLVPWLGLRDSVLAMGCVNLVAGVCFLWLSRAEAPADAAAPHPVE